MKNERITAMRPRSVLAAIACVFAISLLTACQEGASNVLAPAPGGGGGATSPPASLGVSPSTLSFTIAGAVQTFNATEAGYGGALTAANGTPSCAGIATFTPSGSGPSAAFTVTAVSAGICQIVIHDSGSQTAAIAITVTTTGGVIN